MFLSMSFYRLAPPELAQYPLWHGFLCLQRILTKRIICLKTPCGAHTPYGIILGNFNGIEFLPLRGVFCEFLQAVRSGSWATWNSGIQ